MEYSAIDTTQIIVTLISTIGAFFCAVLGKKKEENKPPMLALNNWAVGMWVCIAIAVINSGFLGWRLLRPGSTISAAVTYPINQAKVNQTETVRGTIQELPSEQVIWVVVFAQDVGRYYPQNRHADIEAGNNWSSIVFIGVPSDTGKRFDILVLLVNSEAQDALNNYLEEARDQNDWPGLEAIPEGAVIYDRITVTRK